MQNEELRLRARAGRLEAGGVRGGEESRADPPSPGSGAARGWKMADGKWALHAPARERAMGRASGVQYLGGHGFGLNFMGQTA
jgi:hypothetical protein